MRSKGVPSPICRSNWEEFRRSLGMELQQTMRETLDEISYFPCALWFRRG